MTSLGSGLTSNIGGPQEPTPRELEATAATQVSRSAMAIVRDSLEIPFTQMGGQIWKYKSDPNRPTLMQTGSTRVSIPRDEVTDESWKPFFDDLVSKMHPDMRMRLMADMKKPFEMRNAFYSVLENVLNTTAKGLAGLDQAKQPQKTTEAAFQRTEQNQALIGTAFKAITQQSAMLLNNMQGFLDDMGPNFPEYDAIKPFVEQGLVLQGKFAEILEQLKQPDGMQPEQAQLADLADEALALSKEFGSLSRGNSLQMLGPLFESMAAVAAALSMTPASPSLFLGLKIAGKGIFDSESMLGMLGPELQAIVQALGNGLFASLMSKVGSAKQQMMLLMLLASLYGSASLAGLVAKFGVGRFPSDNEGEEQSGQLFTMELLLSLLANSGLIKEFYKILAKACGSTERTENVISSGLELATLLLATLNGAQGKTNRALYLLKGIKNKLGANINQLETYLYNALQTGMIHNPEARTLEIAFKEAQAALKNDQIEGLLTACKTALRAINSSPELLIEDLESIKEFVVLIQRSCGHDSHDKNAVLTGMITTG